MLLRFVFLAHEGKAAEESTQPESTQPEHGQGTAHDEKEEASSV